MQSKEMILKFSRSGASVFFRLPHFSKRREIIGPPLQKVYMRTYDAIDKLSLEKIQNL